MLKRYYMFVVIFVFSFIFIMKTNAEVESKNYNSTNKTLTIKVKSNMGAAEKIQSIRAKCTNSSGKSVNLPYIYYSQKNVTETASWNLSKLGMSIGNWSCVAYVDVTEWNERSYNFSFWKSSFPSCSAISNYKSNPKSYCGSSVPDDGDSCVWTGNGCFSVNSSCYVFKEKKNCDLAKKNCGWNGSECSEWKNFQYKSICEKVGYYWYNDKCNKTASTNTTGHTCGDTNYGTWTKDSCNAKVESGKCHLWDSTNNCCKVTNGSCSGSTSGGSSGGGSSSGGSSTPSKTDKEKCEDAGNIYNENTSIAPKGCYQNDEENCKIFGYCWESGKCNLNKKCENKNESEEKDDFRILFDQNYGLGLACDAGFEVPTAGVCQKSVKAGTAVNFPASSKSMLKDSNSLIGWTKTLENGVPLCTSNTIVTDKSYKVETDTDFYACYQENINANLFVRNGYVADGGSVDYECGQTMWIEYCTQESGVGYCYYYDNGTYRKVYRDKIVPSYAAAGCSVDDSSKVQIINEFRYVGKSGSNYSCGDQLYITDCTGNECNYSQVKNSSKTKNVTLDVIDRDYLKTTEDSAKDMCELEDQFDHITNCRGDYKNKTRVDMTGKKTYVNFCYEKNLSQRELKKAISEVYSCAKGYSLTSFYNKDGEENCNKHGICLNDFVVICSKGESARPTLAVSTANVQSNGSGLLVVQATASEGRIDSYFVSDYYQTPTNSNNGWVNVNSNKFTIESSPGVKFIWVRDSYGNISKAVRGVVLDTVNSDTTVKNLQLYDANGNVQAPSRVSYSSDNVKSSKYVMMSNALDKDSKVIADGFNPYDMEYNLEVNSPTVTVYATLTSTDSNYVDGFEPRTVNLDYGVNTVLIKIQNKDGKIRTYTILVTRVDDRTSDNTLKDISLSVGKINFNANVTDYKIEIPTTTKEVDIKSTLANDKASYVEGYEPYKIGITSDTTVKLIKVKSETGSTRTYVLTFVKEGTDKITKESLQLSNLVIPGAYIPFEEDVANYSSSVSYETDLIDIATTLKDKNSTIVIKLKKKNDLDYKVVSNNGIKLDVGENFIEIKVIDSENNASYYRLTIIRKEFGLGISNDTTLKDLKVLGYDIDFKANRKEYTVKIKQEKSLVVTAVPNNNRAEVFIRGNEELTGFSTVRVKVVAENGEFETYSIDIKKDAFNKNIEIAAIVAGTVIILLSSGIIIVKKKRKAKKEYINE